MNTEQTSKNIFMYTFNNTCQSISCAEICKFSVAGWNSVTLLKKTLTQVFFNEFYKIFEAIVNLFS